METVARWLFFVPVVGAWALWNVFVSLAIGFRLPASDSDQVAGANFWCVSDELHSIEQPFSYDANCQLIPFWIQRK